MPRHTIIEFDAATDIAGLHVQIDADLLVLTDLDGEAWNLACAGWYVVQELGDFPQTCEGFQEALGPEYDFTWQGDVDFTGLPESGTVWHAYDFCRRLNIGCTLTSDGVPKGWVDATHYKFC